MDFEYLWRHSTRRKIQGTRLETLERACNVTSSRSRKQQSLLQSSKASSHASQQAPLPPCRSLYTHLMTPSPQHPGYSNQSGGINNEAQSERIGCHPDTSYKTEGKVSSGSLKPDLNQIPLQSERSFSAVSPTLGLAIVWVRWWAVIDGETPNTYCSVFMNLEFRKVNHVEGFTERKRFMRRCGRLQESKEKNVDHLSWGKPVNAFYLSSCLSFQTVPGTQQQFRRS